MKFKISKNTFAVWFAYALLLIAEFFRFSNEEIWIYLTVFGMIVISSDIALNFRSLKEILFFIILLILSITIYDHSKTRTPLLVLLLTFGVRDKDLIKLFKTGFFIKLAELIIYLSTYPFLHYLRTGEKYYSYLSTPNNIGLVYFGVITCYVCWQYQRSRLKLLPSEILIILISDILVFFYSGCKTSFLCILLFCMVYMLLRSNIYYKKIKWLLFVGIIVVLLAYIRTAINIDSNAYFKYGTVGSRFMLAQNYFRRYGVTFWGNEIENMGSFDLGYIALVVEQGLIFSILFLFFIIKTFIRSISKNEILLIGLWIMVFLYFAAERSAFSPVTNPMLLYISSMSKRRDSVEYRQYALRKKI